MKKRKNKGRNIKLDADLDNELEGYDVESSDDGLDAQDRILLENARGRKRWKEEEEVLPVHEASSSESEEYIGDDGLDDEEFEDDDNNVDESDEKSVDDDDNMSGDGASSEMDSDIEEKSDGLPDSKAWGSRRKNYYNTDYVDKDYSGFDDEEAAILEEEEAKIIQQRLLGQLEGADFTMGLLDKVQEKRKDALVKNIKLEIDKKIKVDRSKLLETDLKEFDEKETPGYNRIMEEIDNYANYAETVVQPIINFAQVSKMKDCLATRLLNKKNSIILRYCAYFLFLLRLKAHRTSNLARHPIFNRLQQFSKALKEIDALENADLKKQVIQITKILKEEKQEDIGKIIQVVDNFEKRFEVTGKNRKERRKKMLQLLQDKSSMNEIEDKWGKKIKFADEEGMSLEVYANKLEEQNGATQEEADEDNEEAAEMEKRAVTYQMLKNKGLTPKRKKEVRNPRVRNKNKFKKALVRRKGQVKLPRNEVKKYDGEISGIKKNLSRSVKLY